MNIIPGFKVDENDDPAKLSLQLHRLEYLIRFPKALKSFKRPQYDYVNVDYGEVLEVEEDRAECNEAKCPR